MPEPEQEFDIPRFEMPKIRKTLQLRIREDIQPTSDKESFYLTVTSQDPEGQVTLLWMDAQGPVREEGKVGVTAVNLHIHPHYVDLLVGLNRFVRGEGPSRVWTQDIVMEDPSGVQYLDITMGGAYFYPPFPKGWGKAIFGGGMA
jgi:hypothetical protein